MNAVAGRPRLAILTIVLALSVAWQWRIGLWGDVVWLLMLDERWFAGERPYIDFLEINPPASLLIYAPEVWVAQTLGVASESVVVAAGFALAAFSLGFAGLLLHRAGRLGEVGPIFIAVAFSAFWFLPGDAFMEREVQATAFLAPALALAEARAERARVGLGEAALAGIGVGLAIALKPPYGLAAVLPALYVLARTGPRALIRSVEIPAAALVVAGYALLVWRFFPAYAQNMLPALRDVYLPVRLSALDLLRSEGAFDFLALTGFGLLLAGRSAPQPALAIPALAALGAFAGYAAQGKGWLYQAFPALAFAALFAGRAFERTRPDARETGLALAAGLAALGLGVATGRPGLGLIGAAGAAFALRRLASDAPAGLTFARCGAAAAFGAAAAGFVPAAQPSEALGRALERLGPHPTVMAITESFGFVHPMVRRVGARWTQSVPNLIITSGARLLMDEHPGDAALAQKLAPYVEADRRRLISDIAGGRPDAIVVGPLDTRFHAALWSDPGVQAAMSDYRLFAVNDAGHPPGELWVRRDLAARRGSLAESSP